VIVCDNASTDGSMEKIEDWARGFIPVSCGSPDLAMLILRPIPKPLAFATISASGFASQAPPDMRLRLIQTGSNLGFAGGNNFGIRYALARGDCDYVWLLNNDTVVDPEALSALVRMAQADPKLGICGSLLRSYTPPHHVLTAGGRKYSRWSGRTRPLLDPATPHLSTLPGAPDYIEGASMLISRRCLERTGLLEESYFLYSEEIDYVTRARPDFHFGYSPESIVYHKEGASIGSALLRSDRSVRAEFYLARNRLAFTRKYYPWFLPSVLAFVAASSLHRLVMGKPRAAAAIVRGALAGMTAPGIHSKLE
jgi:GT2 family glycosyltransferase